MQFRFDIEEKYYYKLIETFRSTKTIFEETGTMVKLTKRFFKE